MAVSFYCGFRIHAAANEEIYRQKSTAAGVKGKFYSANIKKIHVN
jgi:hypothetical protein